jgi:hypothetical protein
LSPLNLLRMFANSLFIRFTSDSLLLPLIMCVRLHDDDDEKEEKERETDVSGLIELRAIFVTFTW